MKSTPVPWRKLIPVLLFRVAEACTYVGIFPFVTDMITSFDVAPNRIGLYAGLAEGMLMLVEACCATTWARLADKYGRRPCLIYGFLATLIGSTMVGFSTSVLAVIFWRGLYGLNPSSILRIVAGEITDSTNRAQVFSVFSPSFAFGVIFGTSIGGQLAHPFGRLPGWFGSAQIWNDWPYALPCIVTTIIGIVVVVVSCFALVESRPLVFHAGENEAKPLTSPSVRAVLRVPHFVMFTIVFCCFQITTFAWDGIFTVYTYTEVTRGGLGLPVSLIGTLFSIAAVIYIVSAPFAIPYLRSRLGPLGALRLIFAAWPAVALSIPLAQYAALHDRRAMWVVLVIQLSLKDFGNFSWPMCDTLSVSLFDDRPEMLSMGSAILLIAGASGRAIGPSLSGWIYSISTGFPAGSFGRQMPWMFLLSLSLVPLTLTVFLPNDEVMSRTVAKEVYEDVPLVGEDQDDLEA